MVAAEQALIAAGSSVEALMDQAGRGAAEWVWRLCGGRSATILCGPGNNGGDGYVIAEALRGKGGEVRVIAPLEPKTNAARQARAAYGGPVSTRFADRAGEVFVDCLFGSGLTRPLDGDLVELLASLAGAHRFSAAIDLPSGMGADRGQPLNDGLPRYDLTVSLGAWKYAHWLMPGAAAMGERRLVPIGVAQGLGSAAVLARPRIDAPGPAAHKYTRGLLAVVAGAMPGAALLACEAAMHGGAGYVKLLRTGHDADAMAPPAPADLVIDLRPLAEALGDDRLACVLLGPGLGRDGAAREQMDAVLARDLPLVLDADALVLLNPADFGQRRAPIIATPHAGELSTLARVFGVGGAGKLDQAREIATASGMVIIAKGADTVIAAPDGSIAIAPAASSWLSTAGTGDVLAGLAASRLATGLEPFAAASEAVWLHSRAARLAGPAFAAGELASHVPAAVAECL